MSPVSIHDTILTRSGGWWGDGLCCVTYMNKRSRDDDSGAKLLQHNEEEIQLVRHKLLQQDGSKHAFLIGKSVSVSFKKVLFSNKLSQRETERGGRGGVCQGLCLPRPLVARMAKSKPTRNLMLYSRAGISQVVSSSDEPPVQCLRKQEYQYTSCG